MKEIKLDLSTIKVPRDDSFSIEDLERMFGKRIGKAVHQEPNKNGTVYKAIKTKEMGKICRWWKFWNKDIKEAYKNYVGNLLVPWVIINEPPVISYMSPETGELMTKKIDMSKYIVMDGKNERN